MKIIPSVLNWSYHRTFAGRWNKALDEYIERVSNFKNKYDLKEMGINIAVAGPQDAINDHSPDNLLNIKKKLQDAGLVPIALLGVLEIHADNDLLRASIDNIKRAIIEAKLLGCNVSQFSLNLHGRLSREKQVRVLRECLVELGETAKNSNIDICFEEYCTLSGDQIRTAVEGISHVGLLNDFGNWMIIGEDPVAATMKFMNITMHAHLKDYQFEDGIWKSVPFGQGFINLNKILEIIDAYQSNKTLYVAFETDIDCGNEDDALEECFIYYNKWLDCKS